MAKVYISYYIIHIIRIIGIGVKMTQLQKLLQNKETEGRRNSSKEEYHKSCRDMACALRAKLREQKALNSYTCYR